MATGSVAASARIGVSLKSYYQWLGVAEQYGLDALVAKDRRRPNTIRRDPSRRQFAHGVRCDQQLRCCQRLERGIGAVRSADSSTTAKVVGMAIDTGATRQNANPLPGPPDRARSEGPAFETITANGLALFDGAVTWARN